MTEPALLDVFMGMVRAEIPQATQEQVQSLVRRSCAQWGGERLHWPKDTSGKPGRPSKAPEVLRQAYADALGSEPTETITNRHGISRRTLYRLMKRGPPGSP